MMPMAGQNAVLDTAAIEGKPHMRAAIVEGEYTPTFKDEEDWPVATAHQKTPYGHSRVREWVLGGVTRDLLTRIPCCSLLSR